MTLSPTPSHTIPNYLSSSSPLVLLTSYSTTWLFHRLLSKYVFRLWQPQPGLLLFEKRSFFNRPRLVPVPRDELVQGGSVFSTWQWSKGRGRGEGFMVQYAEGEPEKMVKSVEGESVDQAAMSELYREVSQRR